MCRASLRTHRENCLERRQRKAYVYIHPQLSTVVRCLSLALSFLTVHWFLDPNLVLAASLHCFTFSWMLGCSLSWVLLQPLVHTWIIHSCSPGAFKRHSIKTSLLGVALSFSFHLLLLFAYELSVLYFCGIRITQ